MFETRNFITATDDSLLVIIIVYLGLIIIKYVLRNTLTLFWIRRLLNTYWKFQYYFNLRWTSYQATFM